MHKVVAGWGISGGGTILSCRQSRAEKSQGSDGQERGYLIKNLVRKKVILSIGQLMISVKHVQVVQ